MRVISKKENLLVHIRTDVVVVDVLKFQTKLLLKRD
jgi:hypothetical protein